MPDSPTPVQLLGLRDIVVPEPLPKQSGHHRLLLQAWKDDRHKFEWETSDHPLDAIAEFEAIVRAEGCYAHISLFTRNVIMAWHSARGTLLAVADERTEPTARFLAVIRAFIALGMVNEGQATDIAAMGAAIDLRRE